MTTPRVLNTKTPLFAALALCASLAFGAPVFTPSDQPYGNVPPLGLTGFNLSTGTQKSFQAWFDPNSWAGDLSAFPIGTDGRTQISQKLWSARDVFAAKQTCYATDPVGSVSYYDTGRKIVTRGGTTPANIAFRWANFSAAEQASIGDATNGPQIVDFLRGARSNEKYQVIYNGDGSIQSECGVKSPGTGIFRARQTVLGDILHGRPVFVGAPPADYLFDNYQAFKTSNSARAQRVYVGGNDGMMHSFDVATGEEVWAYIPSTLLGNLKSLSVDPYVHKYFVDGGVTAGDVNIGSSGTPDWRTVIVGGLGAGGKAFFALDVTVPAPADENAAKSKILWEITPSSSGFADLGYTYGDPVIARLNTGEWAMIVGNGYLNTNTGHAVLYIINIATGALIKSLDTGSGSVASPNGLSSPIAVDTNFDGKVDRVYAGDIDGNVWKFDISGATASSWTAPSTPFYVTGRAIRGAPDVATHPISGFLVYFGTGRLLTAADAADSTVQNYAYGIWDGAPAANNTLLDQTLTEKPYGAQRVRVSTGLPINWNDASNASTKPLHFGWRTALPPGERVVGTGFVRDARYHFSAVNPTITKTPPPNGENWLHELDFETGGAKDKPIFDLNADSLLNDGDRVSNSTGNVVLGPTGIPVAVYMGAGLLSQPVLAILNAQLSTTLFNDNPYAGPGDQPSVPPAPILDPGVSGGHFDVDIYYGATTVHTHEYDDKFDVTGVNFLNASDPKFNISNAITSTSTKFKILIANQKLSPAVSFSFGGNLYARVTTLETTAGLTLASLPTYTRADVSTLKYNMPKDAFAAKDWAGTGDVRVGLVPTQTGCVHGTAPGTVGPAPDFLYRNGAMVWQLVKDTTPDSAVQLADAEGDPKYGYRLKDASRSTYLLAEWSTFWHHPNGKCMGDAGWTQTPPMDTDPSTAKASTPAAGSEDPPRDQLGSVVSTTSSTNPDPGCSGCTIRKTVTNYSTGAQLIVTQYISSKGRITNTTTQYVLPPSGSGTGSAGSGVGQSVSSPNTVTGYQQTRNTGKLGRVTWHELFRQ